MNTEQVIIDDDNDSIETVEILDEDIVINSVNTINLDEEISLNGTSNIVSDELFANLLRNNRLMSKLVRKCLNMKDSEGMARVIHKTVLPMYKDTDSSFKASAHLRRVIKTTLKQLELDSSHKFSHLKSLCSLLQSKKHRKKVPFITLSTSTDLERRTEQCPGNNNISQIINENVITKINEIQTDVIDLVNSDKEIIIVDSNEEEYIINLDDQKDIGQQTPRSDNSDKENNILSNRIDLGIIQLDKDIPNTGKHNVESNLLTPHKHEDFNVESAVVRRVQMIEAEIAIYKSKIEKLEQLEVTNETQSPYLQCDKMKAKVVSLYEELCRLTGEQSMKRREVRLQVTEGHPPGPVRRLEEFLNKNIDSMGNPPFPDFHDVLDCVQRANCEDNLKWTKAIIIKEATSLFTQCGHALRKRRQKREWRDLMSLVKEEQPDADPADEDPQLSAILEQNKRLAQEKEHQILEKFTQMEYLPTTPPKLSPRLGNMDIIQDMYDDTSDSESEDNASSTDGVHNCESTKSNKDTEETDNMNIDQEIASSNTNEANVDSESVQIKQEPVDIQGMLDGLGSDYTVTVFDIEDPFLVIEISSDSSYSDDENS